MFKVNYWILCHVHFPVSSPTLVLLSVSFFAYKFGDPNSKALFHLWSVPSEISQNQQRLLFWIMGLKNTNLTNVKHYSPSVGDFFLSLWDHFFWIFFSCTFLKNTIFRNILQFFLKSKHFETKLNYRKTYKFFEIHHKI